jgi:outer membrane lipoprotein LolB
MRLLKILICCTLIFLTACSTMLQRNPSTYSMDGFNVQGLVGVTTSQGQNSANFNWYQHGGGYHIALYGPMALGSTYLDSDGTNVTLTLSDQENYTATSPELLMQNVLGWSMPVTGLHYWLFAKPVPNEPYENSLDSHHRVIQLNQEGWDIHYLWQDQQSFPHKITLVRPGIKVVIVINKIY